jgi:hypothetical protein
MIHEVMQNNVQVHDNILMHKNLDHFVNYLNVLIEKPESEKFLIFFFCYK